MYIRVYVFFFQFCSKRKKLFFAGHAQHTPSGPFLIFLFPPTSGGRTPPARAKPCARRTRRVTHGPGSRTGKSRRRARTSMCRGQVRFVSQKAEFRNVIINIHERENRVQLSGQLPTQMPVRITLSKSRTMQFNVQINRYLSVR